MIHAGMLPGNSDVSPLSELLPKKRRTSNIVAAENQDVVEEDSDVEQDEDAEDDFDVGEDEDFEVDDDDVF